MLLIKIYVVKHKCAYIFHFRCKITTNNSHVQIFLKKI